jgi:quercetin dioxygenase-like cupin family protein
LTAYETATIEQLADAIGWSAIRLQLGVGAFGINAWTAAEPGAAVIVEHDEAPSGHEEIYVVTSGHATFTVEGSEIDAPAGSIVFVRDPATRRGAVAREPGTTVLAVGAKPGTAYRPRAWETNARVFPLFDAGDFAGAKRVLEDALGRYEDRGALLFNLACAETQLGERDAALAHLAQAARERPDLVAHAREDDDLAALRDDPRFEAALSGR